MESPEAIVITGMRRVGKTALLFDLFQSLDSKNKIFLDLENPLNRKYFEEENYERIGKSFQFLGIDLSKKSCIFLDEIQFVKTLPSVVKYFIDHHQVKFFLTGSASFYLKHLFSESLAGRKYLFELFPLTFAEFLVFKDVDLKIPEDPREVTAAMFDALSMHHEEYVLYGGFPGVVLKEGVEEKYLALDDIFSSYFNMEVLQLGDFRKNDVLRDLMLLLAQRVGSRLDVQKLSKELGVTRPTLYEYLSFLEATYFIKMVRPFSRGRDAEIRKMPKVYVCDSGMAHHLARLEGGHLFENSIFQNLRMKGEVNYYQKKSGVEIDFIVDRNAAYEVKVRASASDVKRLATLSAALRLPECKVISQKRCDPEGIIYGFML